MENRNTLFIIVLVLIGALSVFSALLLYRYVKKVESEYTEKEAGMIKETMDLKDRIDDMKISIGEKTKEVNAVKSEKEKLAEKIRAIEEENKKLEEKHRSHIKILETEKEELAKQIKTFKETPLAEFIRKAKDVEENESIRKVLERTLHNIELVRSGNVVDLEPIVVSQGEEPEKAAQEAVKAPAIDAVFSSQGGAGEILSIDKNNNLIVINLGTKDRIREGQRLSILDGAGEIASAEIISSRYRISAAFIDDIKHKHTIGDIKTGFKVLMGK